MKGNNNPIPAVITVMTAVGILFGLKPDSKIDPATQKRVYLWWPPIQKLLSRMTFLDDVKNFDKDGLTPQLIKEIQPYTQNEIFDSKKLQSLNMVASNFCLWI